MNKEQIQFHAEWWARHNNGESIESIDKDAEYHYDHKQWIDMEGYPGAYGTYRWKPEKPKTVTIEIPKPAEERPNQYDTYFVLKINARSWFDRYSDQEFFETGNCFYTEEHAGGVIKALSETNK